MLSKFHPWLLWILLGTPNLTIHSFTSTHATVVAFWSFVGIACVNFVKTSVRTNVPLLPLSSTVESIAKISNVKELMVG